MQITSKQTLLDYLRGKSFRKVLDAPSGAGWLFEALGKDAVVDGVDLYAEPVPGYRRLWKHDLDAGLPADCDTYDLICCCEGLEHVGNPLLLLTDAHRHLADQGLLVVTTPNVWYPQARLQYWLRGFFPSFPPLPARVVRGTHMHITPWSFPQLYVYFRLAGFTTPEIIREPMSAPKHLHERLLVLPAWFYCRGKVKKAKSDDERAFWQAAGSPESLFGRHLIVVARKDPSIKKT